jgi:hypothetical protein
MERDGDVRGLGAPVAGVATRKPRSVVQVFFPDRELMALSGLDGDAPFAAVDQFTRNRAVKEAMFQAIEDKLPQALEHLLPCTRSRLI